MATFTVNGQSVTVEKNQKLIRFLRDTLHLTSVKDGCSEGACGTCHVLIDGKPTKACIPQTDKLEGKTILTVEGLSDLGKAGLYLRLRRGGSRAVRLLHPRHGHLGQGAARRESRTRRARRPPSPSATISAAAPAMSRSSTASCWRRRFFREGKIPEGRRRRLADRLAASTGSTWRKRCWATGQYPDDVYVDGMCYGGAVRSRYAARPGALSIARQRRRGAARRRVRPDRRRTSPARSTSAT